MIIVLHPTKRRSLHLVKSFNRNKAVSFLFDFLVFKSYNSYCGNGIREEGEECDCGTPEVCDCCICIKYFSFYFSNICFYFSNIINKSGLFDHNCLRTGSEILRGNH